MGPHLPQVQDQQIWKPANAKPHLWPPEPSKPDCSWALLGSRHLLSPAEAVAGLRMALSVKKSLPVFSKKWKWHFCASMRPKVPQRIILDHCSIKKHGTLCTWSCFFKESFKWKREGGGLFELVQKQRNSQASHCYADDSLVPFCVGWTDGMHWP